MEIHWCIHTDSQFEEELTGSQKRRNKALFVDTWQKTEKSTLGYLIESNRIHVPDAREGKHTVHMRWGQWQPNTVSYGTRHKWADINKVTNSDATLQLWANTIQFQIWNSPGKLCTYSPDSTKVLHTGGNSKDPIATLGASLTKVINIYWKRRAKSSTAQLVKCCPQTGNKDSDRKKKLHVLLEPWEFCQGSAASTDLQIKLTIWLFKDRVSESIQMKRFQGAQEMSPWNPKGHEPGRMCGVGPKLAK